MVKTPEGEARAQGDVVHVRHPRRVGSLKEAPDNKGPLELRSKPFSEPIEWFHYERIYEAAITRRERPDQHL